ncbi:MAG TPA: SulP family inorganic anion transporter [Burkholderiales bacterium]|nr:SulP family inorganic anion transporter [Burkholderiales bacterium]
MIPLQFRPALLDALEGYNGPRFMADLSAGLTVAVVALPLAMAFAIASGLKPEAGIFTAIIGGFLISALGGSRVQIGGPAGAFIVIVYGIVATYGLANLLIATICAGVLMFVMGAMRLGRFIRFIPVSIVIGFTNGIAVLIAISQLRDFFGLQITELPADFFGQMKAFILSAASFNPYSVALGATSLALVVLWPKSYSASDSTLYRLLARVPGTLIVLILGTLAVAMFNIPVETIGSRFGGIPRDLPEFVLPEFEWKTVQHLFGPIITIAILGAIESLLCARVADSMIGDRHDPNQELMAQGIANVAAPLFGGLCATGTIARTATNVRAGATSPIAGMVHALALLIVLLAAAPLAQNVPLASLAAILLFVAWNMGEWREFARLKNFSHSHRIILLTTFVLTIVMDLTVAVEVGIVLSCVFFIVRVATGTRVEEFGESERNQYEFPQSVGGYRIIGALFFGAVNKLDVLIDRRRLKYQSLIVDLSGVFMMDATGLEALESLHRQMSKHGGRLILVGPGPQVADKINRAGFGAHLGPEGMVTSIEEAVNIVNHRLRRPVSEPPTS